MINETTVRQTQQQIHAILQLYVQKLAEKIGNGNNIFSDLIEVSKTKDSITIMNCVNSIMEREQKSNPSPDELLEEI